MIFLSVLLKYAKKMTALPEDILLEILKYSPKSLSSTCKALRKKFNVYDHWILSDKIFDQSPRQPTVWEWLKYMIIGVSLPKPTFELDFKKIKYVAVTHTPNPGKFRTCSEIVKKCFSEEGSVREIIFIFKDGSKTKYKKTRKGTFAIYNNACGGTTIVWIN